MPRSLPLNNLPMRQCATIAAIDWGSLSTGDARRMRELGFDEGVTIEKLHQAPLGRDPLAVRIGRMTVAIRRAHAAAVSVVVAA